MKTHSIDTYYETSALNGENVEKPFFDLANEILGKIENGVINVDLETAYGVKRGRNKKNLYQNHTIQLEAQNKTNNPESSKCNC